MLLKSDTSLGRAAGVNPQDAPREENSWEQRVMEEELDVTEAIGYGGFYFLCWMAYRETFILHDGPFNLHQITTKGGVPQR